MTYKGLLVGHCRIPDVLGTRALYDRQVSPPLRVRLGAVNVLMRIGDDIYNVRGLFCCLAFFKVQSADSAHRIALTAVSNLYILFTTFHDSFTGRIPNR